MFKKKRNLLIEYLNEPRPLPLGRKEFEEWSDEIIRLAEIPSVNLPLSIRSWKFALAEMVLHVKPTQSFESFAHFVHCLRKGAANEVAHKIFKELKLEHEERIKQEVQPKTVKELEQKVLEKPKLQDATS